jgi:Rieske Fe-S protein
MTRPTPTSRRVVFHGLSVLGAAGVLAGCGGSEDDGGDATDPSPAEPTSGGTGNGGGNGGGSGALAEVTEVPVGGGLILADEKIVLTQPAEGDVKGFSAVCTHQGCTVGEVTDTINCPCHQSMFSIEDGSVQGGPAPSPLGEVEISVEGDQISLA